MRENIKYYINEILVTKRKKNIFGRQSKAMNITMQMIFYKYFMLNLLCCMQCLIMNFVPHEIIITFLTTRFF